MVGIVISHLTIGGNCFGILILRAVEEAQTIEHAAADTLVFFINGFPGGGIDQGFECIDGFGVLTFFIEEADFVIANFNVGGIESFSLGKRCAGAGEIFLGAVDL